MRKKGNYFERTAGAPAPIACSVRRRVSFSDCDPMGIVWFGRYASYCEAAAAELGRRCGLSYADFYEAGLRAPVASYHVDYFVPLRLDEEIEIRALQIWTEAARINTEFVIRNSAGNLAATACTVQLLIDAATGQVCIATPALLERCRRRWLAGEFEAES